MTTEPRPTGTATIRGIRAGSFWTNYVEAGDPADPAVVLLHDGAYGSSAWLCWEHVIADIAEDHYVVAPDLLGFGGTDKAVFLDRSPYSFRIEHIADFVRALGITDAAFIGASFGGSVLVRAAAQYPHALPMSKALTLSGSGGPFRLASGIEALADYDMTVEDIRRLTGLIVSDLDGLEEHVQARYAASIVPGHWEVQNAPRLKSPRAGSAPARVDPFIDDLASVTIPVTFVEGRHDQLLEDDWARRMSELTPGSRYVVGDFAHEPNIDRPELLLPIVREFLADRPS